ncbi:carbohydrate esterase family 5 protein [Baudoinia panamericana UAMH 10762]|uniref:Carbohydrate esterase family 5 protein n=1 Tax=Baudoinia panamericana (strain UAMH 10762) TaxID=717646 RepID=M2MX17_BAUPA|nr:carbohydrate esterase family 5 protein [Baudoinia panamericana UAMH 10762]EMC96088.1 carbohydrate esterase family 5 protein [Baudoinia panamericana UAMH 10762]
MAFFSTFSLLALALSAIAAPIEERAAACTAYTLIDTRGTGEAQGPSAGFRTMNSNIRSQIPGGTEYDTVYPAGSNQDSSAGTQDIVNHINSGLASNPNMCFILEGYSQGAAATVNALPKITGAAFTAVRGVFLIGNPEHKAGLACNVDANGGTTTLNVNGLSAYGSNGIPSNWVSKTLDVCAFGDGVCDTKDGYGINAQHLSYPSSTSVQNLGTTFVEGKLKGTS